MACPVLVLDNGASTIKAGYASSESDAPMSIPNAIVRSKADKKMYIGPDMINCHDYFALHYRLPFDRGYLTDWDTEKAIWDLSFSKSALSADPRELSLLVTEPYFNLPAIKDTYDQLIFEEYEFQSYSRGSPASFIPYGVLFNENDRHSSPECMLIVDSGFSFTHVVPLLSGKIVWSGVRRIDVGGKFLTNQLKEVISYRHYNMMDQTYIVNDIKEKCCYVSQSFESDLLTCRNNPRNNKIVQEYVLPDFSINRLGFVRTSADKSTRALSDEEAKMPVVYMGNERFSVPELLFNPSDIGLEQAGLPETIAHSISSLPQDLQGMFWANIGLIGGNVMFPGLDIRLRAELRQLAPVDSDVRTFKPRDPIVQAYQSAWAFAKTPHLQGQLVTRAEYLEFGVNICRRKFGEHDGQVAGGAELATASGGDRTGGRRRMSRPNNPPTKGKPEQATSE
ncbi:Actin- protein 6 [Tulasnella sp. 418]|nr:Actin- protein 6 [Tulasnella sp. 418]